MLQHNQVRSAITEACQTAPVKTPFIQELCERLTQLDEHLRETLQASADFNGHLFGPRPENGSASGKDDPVNRGVTALVLDRLNGVEQLAFRLRDQINESRQIV